MNRYTVSDRSERARILREADELGALFRADEVPPIGHQERRDLWRAAVSLLVGVLYEDSQCSRANRRGMAFKTRRILYDAVDRLREELELDRYKV